MDDISHYYTVQHPDQFAINWTDFYRAAITRTRALREQVRSELGVSYGPDPKQKLDVYLPAHPDGSAPIMVFAHGGGFVEGDGSLYGFVAQPYVARGVIVVVASYRLASAGFHYPAQANDIREATVWAWNHAARLGGDPDRLHLAGHSAGALLAADLGVNRRWMTREGMPAGALRGVIAISAGYDLVRYRRYPEYVPTLTLRYAASPVFQVDNPTPAFLIAAGGDETVFGEPSQVFADVLRANDVNVLTEFTPGRDHCSIVEDFANDDSALCRKVLKLIGPRTGIGAGSAPDDHGISAGPADGAGHLQ